MIDPVQVGAELQVHDIIPGSLAAIDAGCTCNVVALAGYQESSPYLRHRSSSSCHCFINSGCPIHGRLNIFDTRQIQKPSHAQ